MTVKEKFDHILKLRKKLSPVLRTKVNELRKNGICNITEQEIWNYLVVTKWKNKEELYLSEMVDDILKLEID